MRLIKTNVANGLRALIDELFSRVSATAVRLSKVPILIHFFAQTDGDNANAGEIDVIGSTGLGSVGPPLPPPHDPYTDGWAYLLPLPGVLSALAVNISANSLNGPTTVTLYQNGIVTPVTVTFAPGQTGAELSTGFSVPVAAGTLIWVVMDTTASTSGTAEGISMTFIETLPIPPA